MLFSDLFAYLSNNTLSRAELSNSGKVRNIHYGDVLIKYGEVIDIEHTEIPYVADVSRLRKPDYLSTGDVVIADTAEDDTVGKAVEIINNSSVAVVSGLHTIPCRPKKRFVPSYLGYYVNSAPFHTQLHPYMQGIKVTSISKGNIGKTYISSPDLEEQQKITSLLNLLSSRIEKQRQLVEALKSYKRGLSTALFTRRIRIANAGESQLPEWKKRSLGEVFSERTERARGDEKLLAVTINNGVQDRETLELKDNSSEDKTNYKVVHIGDLAYNSMRMWQGACGVSSYDGIVSPAYTVVFVADPEMDYAPFWGYYFKEISMLHTFQRNSQGLTSDTWNLKYDKFSKIIVNTPCLEEQVRIASLIDHVSNAITVNEELLDRLLNYKRGLLAGMFI